jgi:GGDEF domain-containing protein
MIDTDCLKSVNDQFGHAFGDEFLRELAAVIRREVRSGDVVVRYAGDEFIALLVEASSEAARQVAERIRLAVQAMQIGIDIQANSDFHSAVPPGLDDDGPDYIGPLRRESGRAASFVAPPDPFDVLLTTAGRPRAGSCPAEQP